MSTEVKAEKLREDERILQAIDKCIDSRDDEYEKNKGILREILMNVVKTMKGQNSFFRDQCHGFFFAENHYKGLKVGKIEEFDVNVIIKIPHGYCYMKSIDGEMCYQKLRLLNDSVHPSQAPKHQSFVSTWLIKEPSENVFYIDKNAFQYSMGSLFAQTLNVPKIDNYTIKVHKKGPPFTLCVNKQGLPEMHVSLVPVMEVNCTAWDSVKSAFECYVVPEIPQKVNDGHLQWAVAFYKYEDALLTMYSHIEASIRRIEKLRDTQQWTVIPSYHIKALFMQYVITIEDNSQMPEAWKLTGIKLFIHMLNELRNVCKFREHEDIVEQLTVIIQEISDDPAKLADWLLTSEELSVYRNELTAIGNLEDIDGVSKDLRMSEESEPASSKDLTTSDGVPKLVPGATTAPGCVKSSPSIEAGEGIAGYDEELVGVVATLRDVIEILSRLSTALEQKLVATA